MLWTWISFDQFLALWIGASFGSDSLLQCKMQRPQVCQKAMLSSCQWMSKRAFVLIVLPIYGQNRAPNHDLHGFNKIQWAKIARQWTWTGDVFGAAFGRNISDYFGEEGGPWQVSVAVQGEILFEGIPGCELEVDECFWEIDEAPRPRCIMWLFLKSNEAATVLTLQRSGISTEVGVIDIESY